MNGWRVAASGWVGAAVLLLVLSVAAAEQPRLQIHEWGTFTTLQDEFGDELSGVNIDDEPVPEFVHNLSPQLLASPVLTDENWRFRSKGAPRRHPLVTMRLETPVIYFYPPAGASLPLTLDVHVDFRGGWLTEFYPPAQADAPGLGTGSFRFGYLSPSTTGRLRWNDLRIGTDGVGPATDEHVWTTPRKVDSAPVSTADGASERYLFYRGVANLHAPLRVSTDLETDERVVSANFYDVLMPNETATIRGAWLTEIRADGTTAFRRLGTLEVTASRRPVLARVNARFAADDFTADNLERLRGEMHDALLAEGLRRDEATAMLETWRRAYFQSPGLRLFFTVPQVWTDRYLPLSISEPADITRVMMGRIELISHRQRVLLKRLAEGTASDGQWLRQIPSSHSAQKARLAAGRADFGDLGVEIPEDYQSYLQLGRFRNALIASEERRRPTNSLSQFIEVYGLEPYRW